MNRLARKLSWKIPRPTAKGVCSPSENSTDHISAEVTHVEWKLGLYLDKDFVNWKWRFSTTSVRPALAHVIIVFRSCFAYGRWSEFSYATFDCIEG